MSSRRDVTVGSKGDDWLGACRIAPSAIALRRSSDPQDPDATLRKESRNK
jgi:hypothetical protein